MYTYKNKAFTKRDYEATNIVFCQSEKEVNLPNWALCDEKEIEAMGCHQLWVEQNGKRIFGWL